MGQNYGGNGRITFFSLMEAHLLLLVILRYGWKMINLYNIYEGGLKYE
jgi:hypothetical protein